MSRGLGDLVPMIRQRRISGGRTFLAVDLVPIAAAQMEGSQYSGTLPDGRQRIQIGAATPAVSHSLCRRPRRWPGLIVVSTPRMWREWNGALRASRAVALGLFRELHAHARPAAARPGRQLHAL
jgi:hypothetical protein